MAGMGEMVKRGESSVEKMNIEDLAAAEIAVVAKVVEAAQTQGNHLVEVLVRDGADQAVIQGVQEIQQEIVAEGEAAKTDVQRILKEVATGTEGSLEERIIKPEMRSVMEAAFARMQERLLALSPDEEDDEARYALDTIMDDVGGELKECWSESISESEYPLLGDLMIGRLNLVAPRLPQRYQDRLFVEFLARLPEEVVLDQVKAHHLSLSKEARLKIIYRIAGSERKIATRIKEYPEMTKDISPKELIVAISNWNPLEAAKLLIELPPEDLEEMAVLLCIQDADVLLRLPPALATDEGVRRVAHAAMAKKPSIFPSLAHVLGESIDLIADTKSDYLVHLVKADRGYGEVDGALQSLDADLPLDEDDVEGLMKSILRMKGAKAFTFLDTLKTVEERIYNLPEERREKIILEYFAEDALVNPNVSHQLLKRFNVSPAFLRLLEKKHPKLAEANYLNPEYAGLLTGVPLRRLEQEDVSPDTVVEAREQREQYLAKAEQLSQKISEIMTRLRPDRLVVEAQRLQDETKMRRPAKYIAEVGRGVSAPQLMVFEKGEMPAVYKATVRERGVDAHGQILRYGIPVGESAAREWLAAQIDKAYQFDVVPPTILRDGPDGVGSVQAWQKGKVGLSLRPEMLNAETLMPIAAFHALVENTDGHSGNYLVPPPKCIDNGFILSACPDTDALLSHPVEHVGYKEPIPTATRERIRFVRETEELLEALHEAFVFALGKPADAIWQRFQKNADRLDPPDASQPSYLPRVGVQGFPDKNKD